MNKYLTIYCLFMLVSWFKAQDTVFYSDGVTLSEVGRHNEKFQKVGEWRFYYPSGKLKEVSNFENDKRVGEFIQYHESGQRSFIGQNKNGLPIGKWKIYHENGQLSLVQFFKRGK